MSRAPRVAQKTTSLDMNPVVVSASGVNTTKTQAVKAKAKR